MTRLHAVSWGVLVGMVLAGCSSQISGGGVPTVVVGGVACKLVSQTSTYAVGEPLRLALHVENVTNTNQELPPVLGARYELDVRGPGGDERDRGSWSVSMSEADLSLLPGDSRTIELPRSSEGSCFTPGKHRLRYRYFGTESREEPQWVTPCITIACVEQPLVIPAGTDVRVMRSLLGLQDAPPGGCSSMRPGWTTLFYSDPMTELAALEDEAVTALLANIHVHSLEMEIIQLLGDLRVKQAVPLLLDRLWMQDSVHDWLIIAKLAEITEHPDGYRFHRRWFDQQTRLAAVKAYRDWWAAYQREHADLTGTRTAEPEDGLDIE